MVDQQVKKGSFNGSFLVLNLGTNTLEVGNSFTHSSPSESFHQIPKGTTLNPPNPNEVNDAFDAVSSSTEGSFSISESSRTKRGTGEEEDPEWVPEKKARKSRNSSSRTVKPKQGPSVSSSPPQIQLGGFSGMLNSSSGPPPPYLMSLLGLFGWKVVFQPGKGDYVYISPAGLPYYSLPKAFETFLQGTSKYSDKASFSSRYVENNSLGGSLVQRTAASSTYLGIGSDIAADGSGKKCRGRRKKNLNIKPVEPIEEQPQPKDDPLIDNGKKECQEASQASSLFKVNDGKKCYADNRSLSNEFNQAACSTSLANRDSLCNVKLSGARRSVLMSETHVAIENEMNELSGSGVYGDKANDKEQNRTSRSENMLKERLNSCKISTGLNNGVRNADCNTMGVMRSGPSRRRSTGKGSRLVGLRRFGRLNKKNDVLDRDLDTKKQAESSFSVSTKHVARTEVIKEQGKSLVSECVSDEKTDCSTSDESLPGETKRSNSSSAILLSESSANNMPGCHDTTGIRRSMRINGKHVPVDDDSDVQLGCDDCFVHPSDFGASNVGKKDKEKPMNSSFELDDQEGGNPASYDMLKQTTMNNSCSQKSRFEISSASLKEKRMEIHLSEKCSPLFAAEVRLVVNREKKKKRRGGCGLTIRRKRKDGHQEEILSQTKINILSWLINCGTLTENERIYYITKDGSGNTPGFVTRKGIWCNCCKALMPLSKFAAHAGGELQQSWDNIFLLSGKTLPLCLKETWEKEKIQRKIGFRTVGVGDPDPSDDTCGICADGGHLICCDSCPSTFHQTCLMLKTLPEGSWHCPYCICTFCMAVVRGSDMPLETLNLLSCKHCGRKYHKSCAWENDMNLMGSVPFSFCGKNCQKVATELSDVLGIINPIEEGFSWTLLKCFDKDAGIISNQRLSFIMESNVKLSMALSVLDECFVPLIDHRTGVDMICQAVYNCGSNFNRLNCEGFYTLILERDEEIISAASLRLHGTSLAEMPFIGTRPMYRRQGMCRRLLKAVEDILCSLHVEKLIIPAIPDMLETWTKSFSFKPLEPSHKEEVKNLSLMVFAETTLLQKPMHSTGAVVQEDVVPVDNGVSCKNIQESCKWQRTFGGQINTRSHFGSGENKQETHEFQRYLGDQINTRNQFESGKNIQESHELQRTFGDRINTRSHFGIGNNIQKNHELQRSFADQINTRSHLIDNGSSYGKNIQSTHEIQRSFGEQINTRSHFEIGNKITQESPEVQRSFADQINSKSHSVDNGVSYGDNIHHGDELLKSFGNQINTISHFGSGNNIQESQEVQRSFGDQINNRGHFGFCKNIEEDHGLLRSCNHQINNSNHFGGAPDWWIYECILKGQTSPSELSRIIKDSGIVPDSLAVLPPNLPSGTISEASPSQHTFMTNLSKAPHNLTANMAHGSLAVPRPNVYIGSISEASPFQRTFLTDVCSVPQNPTTSMVPDSSAIPPPKISNGSISETPPFQPSFMTNLSTVSHDSTNCVSPHSSAILPPNIFNGSICEAAPSEHTVMLNRSTVPYNPTTISSPMSSNDLVLDVDPLGVETIAAPNSHMNSQSQGVDEVKNLQMDAISSSISFDNLLRGIS